MNAPAVSLERRRAGARERFRTTGIPHRRMENWKYTDIGSALSADEVLHADFAGWSFGPLPEGAELVELYPRREFPTVTPLIDEKDAVWAQELLGSVGRSSSMSDASLGFARSGFAVRIPSGASGNSKLDIKRSGQVRGLIVLENGASLTLVHRSGGLSRFQNLGLEIVLGKNSRLTYVRITPKSSEAIQFCEISARLADGASISAHLADGGGKLSRTEMHIALEGAGAEAHLSGVGVLDGTHADVTTHITHAVPDTQSTQLFKYVAGGKGRGVYQGKVSVAPGADGSDSRQTAKGLLLGDRAEIDLKPELEILADDVKCAHGVAVGDLDVESLFYLKSRGIPEAEARALLMRAFLGDAVDQIADETIHASVWQAVETALERLV